MTTEERQQSLAENEFRAKLIRAREIEDARATYHERIAEIERAYANRLAAAIAAVE